MEQNSQGVKRGHDKVFKWVDDQGIKWGSCLGGQLGLTLRTQVNLGKQFLNKLHFGRYPIFCYRLFYWSIPLTLISCVRLKFKCRVILYIIRILDL